MATLRSVILKHQKKSDNSYNVKIRITHNRASAYFSTLHYVNESQLLEDLSIKEKDPISLMVDKEVIRCREIISKLGYRIDNYTAKELVLYLEDTLTPKTEKIDFLGFFQAEYEDLKLKGKNNSSNYLAAYNHIYAFCKGKLCFSDITPIFLKSLEKDLLDKNIGYTGISKYMSCIRASFNRGKNTYNDEELGVIRIPNNPFSKYKVPKEGEAEMKDAGIEVLLDMYNFIPTNRTEELARDMFFLSFYLIGINSKDIHNDETKLIGDRLIYQRSKTKHKRSDNAEISIKVEEEARQFLEKYKGEGNKVFSLSTRFALSKTFNGSLSIGFRQIREKLGYKNLTFYSARHSWATIASHNCDIIDSHIAKCLNHVSIDFKTTNKYIKRDWSILDKCNRQVLDFVADTICLDNRKKLFSQRKYKRKEGRTNSRRNRLP